MPAPTDPSSSAPVPARKNPLKKINKTISKFANKLLVKLEAFVEDVLAASSKKITSPKVQQVLYQFRMHLAIKRATASSTLPAEPELIKTEDIIEKQLSVREPPIDALVQSTTAITEPSTCTIPAIPAIPIKAVYITDSNPILVAFKSDRRLLISLLTNIQISISM